MRYHVPTIRTRSVSDGPLSAPGPRACAGGSVFLSANRARSCNSPNKTSWRCGGNPAEGTLHAAPPSNATPNGAGIFICSVGHPSPTPSRRLGLHAGPGGPAPRDTALAPGSQLRPYGLRMRHDGHSTHPMEPHIGVGILDSTGPARKGSGPGSAARHYSLSTVRKLWTSIVGSNRRACSS